MSEENQDKTQQTTEGQSQEPTKDQADISQDQINKITDKVKKEVEAAYKAQLAGMNTAVSKAENERNEANKALKEKERAAMTAEDRAKALQDDVDNARKEKEKIEAETKQLKRQKTIDGFLSAAELPVEIFESRILGETDKEIEADVKILKEWVAAKIAGGVETSVNGLMAGKTPQGGVTTPAGATQKIDKMIKEGGMNAFSNIIHEARRGE